MNQKSINRILDANGNRLKEALRVIEEMARLDKDQRKLASSLKALRHQVQKAFLKAPVPYQALLKARNSNGDVGRKLRVKDKSRISLKDIEIANFKRAQESSRVLEELFKIYSDRISSEFQSIRFRIYSLEKKFLS